MSNKLYVSKSNTQYRGLPSGYTQVEYIQNDMVGYFDTGVQVSANLRVVADFQLVEKKYGYIAVLFGSHSSTGRLKAVVESNNTFRTDGSSWSQTSNLFARTTVTSVPVTGYESGSSPIFIFAQNETKNYSYSNYLAKLFSLKMYDSTTLIHDYVPCYRNSDGIIGLYDVVADSFLAPVSPIPNDYDRVEYLESTGTQWINTGYAPVTSTGFYMKFKTSNNISNSDYGAILGESNAKSSWTHSYWIETWTNDSKKGNFLRYGTTYDALLYKDTLLTIGHSTVTNTFVRNDGTYVSVNTTAISTSRPMYLLAMNRDGSAYKSATKLYNCVFFETAFIKHNYVPVVRKFDSKPGLYDIIDDVFLTNQGTDEFLYGSVTQGFTHGVTIVPEAAREVKKIYVSRVGHDLPYAYQEVEYIQGTGTQYIDTGVYVSTDSLAFQIDFKLTTNTYNNSATLMGCMLGSTSRFYISCLTSTEVDSKKKRIDIGLGNGWWTDSAQADLERHVYRNSMAYLSVSKDGESKSASGGTYSKATNSNVKIGIFRGHRWDGTWGAGIAQGYLYSAKIWKGGIKIHEYIPCYRKSDNIAGVYDIIGKQFYSSSGTENFLVGDNLQSTAKKIKRIFIGDENSLAKFIWGEKSILPSLYQQVDFIRGTGTQYIDTGVYLDVNSLAIQATASIVSNVYSADAFVIGCYGGSSHRLYVVVKENSDSAAGKIRLGIGAGYYTDSAKVDTNNYVWKVDMKNLTAYKDGVSKAKNSSSAYSRNTNNKCKIGILCGTDANGSWYSVKANAKIYSAKIWNNNILIHDYYPCYRKTDFVAGLYDIITGDFLTNAGTGDLIIGNKYEAEL